MLSLISELLYTNIFVVLCMNKKPIIGSRGQREEQLEQPCFIFHLNLLTQVHTD